MRLQQRLHPFTVPPCYFTSACPCLFASIHCFITHAPQTWTRQALCSLFLTEPQWPLWL